MAYGCTTASVTYGRGSITEQCTEQDLQLSGSHLLERKGGPAKVRDSMGQGVHVGRGPWSFRQSWQVCWDQPVKKLLCQVKYVNKVGMCVPCSHRRLKGHGDAKGNRGQSLG